MPKSWLQNVFLHWKKPGVIPFIKWIWNDFLYQKARKCSRVNGVIWTGACLKRFPLAKFRTISMSKKKVMDYNIWNTERIQESIVTLMTKWSYLLQKNVSKHAVRMMELEKSPFCNLQKNNWFGYDLQLMLKP